ncbi:hypothetical protein [Epilithonimonas mollis]|uniref:Uncharacterized protein n=1 Tax=Epilithonimonas mollis TaxID=216903 RepID=A0A1M6UK46_9FLAO|nr:hypothetical protein [Epilithonimonas mollis]SHK69547.1 hypothetical protein SAMN05444371_3342 [Epilithonimonas mollis]
MRELYLKLIDVFVKNEDIKDKYRTAGLSPVQYIDLYSGQDVNSEYFELQIYPALFVNFSFDHRQKPTLATITIRCCYEQLRDTSSLNVTTAEALKFLDFIELTDEIMQTVETSRFGKLTPATTDQQTEETVTDEFILVYSASYTKKPVEIRTGTIEDLEITANRFKAML